MKRTPIRLPVEGKSHELYKAREGQTGEELPAKVIARPSEVLSDSCAAGVSVKPDSHLAVATRV